MVGMAEHIDDDIMDMQYKQSNLYEVFFFCQINDEVHATIFENKYLPSTWK